jgi:hypothetical protein
MEAKRQWRITGTSYNLQLHAMACHGNTPRRAARGRDPLQVLACHIHALYDPLWHGYIGLYWKASLPIND